MSGSYGVIGMFAVGCLAGAVAVAAGFDVPDVHGISVYILYALMLQVGLGLGSRDNLKPVLRAVGPKVLLLAPALSRFCGRMAPISAAGVTSADVALPSIMRASGQAMVPFALIHGLLIDCSVPFFVTFFCKL